MAQQKYYNQQGQSQYAQPTTTPVPILKQINRHNDDGSYSFGYEAADGSFKIETKHQNGEVYGKYGYVDNEGTVREVEYGASKQRGFEPTGELFHQSIIDYFFCLCLSNPLFVVVVNEAGDQLRAAAKVVTLIFATGFPSYYTPHFHFLIRHHPRHWHQRPTSDHRRAELLRHPAIGPRRRG